MTCPEDTVAFWPADLWFDPLDTFQLGVVPIIWTTGSLPNPAGGDPTPWLGRRIPDRFDWLGDSAELNYSAAFYERGGCLVSLPPIRVLVQGFCKWGINNLTVTVNAGNRLFHEHMVALHGNNGTFSGRPRFAVDCGRKYAVETRAFQIHIKTVYYWLFLCAEYCLNTNGEIGPWWLEVAELATGQKFTPCEGCEYGFLESPKGIQPDTWQDLQLDVFPIRTFPLKRNEGMVRLGNCFGDIALVVNTDTGDADRYLRLPLDCEDDSTYARSELFISEDCFEPELSLPPDDDPRWISQCTPYNFCSAVGYVYGVANGQSTSIYQDGTWEGTIPRASFSTSILERWPNGNLKSGESVVIRQIVFRRVRKMTDATTGECVFMETYEVRTMEYDRAVLSYAESTGAGLPDPWYNASIARTQDFGTRVANEQCTFTQGPLPLSPIIPPIEKNGDTNDKCYISGNIFIGLLGSMQRKLRIGTDENYDRAFNIIAPVVRSRALSAASLPSGISVPFKVRVPTGQSTLGPVTVNVIGTALIAVTINGDVDNQTIINLEELLVTYNFLNDILGFLIPGRIQLDDVKAFCED